MVDTNRGWYIGFINDWESSQSSSPESPSSFEDFRSLILNHQCPMNVIVHRTWIAISEGLEQLKIAIIVVFVGKNAFTKHYILGKKLNYMVWIEI